MDYHIDRKLRLHTEPEYKSLYRWAINEIGEDGRAVGQDQIPWAWSFNFTATSCLISDQLEFGTALSKEDRKAGAGAAYRPLIVLKLRPGTKREDDDYWRKTRFSMFGTDRTIEDIRLDIRPTQKESEPEKCRAWGIVSYDFENDFRNETAPDCLGFSLVVKPETFARYVAQINSRAVSDIVFRVGGVNGFYSEWSPSISTTSVKVLTRGAEHEVEQLGDDDIDIPRLGEVSEATLYINHRIGFEILDERSDERASAPIEHSEPLLVSRNGGNSELIDARGIKALDSIKRAAWFIVLLLAMILVRTISGH